VKREGDPRARLRRAFGVPEEGARGVLRRHLARLERARVPVVLPEGEEIENARGRCWVRRLRYPGSVRHGRWSLAEARAVPFAKIAELARQPQLGGVALGDCLFLDTETTGLAGGAGTLVFLCGLGFADGEDLVLEQVFLRAFNEEAAALTFIAERLAQHPVPVTFVGKSFDRHRLAARMTLNRVPSTVLTERHLDLYYLARRAWRAALPDVRLRTVEERVLGLARVDDLPGERAPAAFLEWVRDRTGELERVFEHNRLDVLSLVALLVALGRGAAPGDG
jgi:hypothetical protein